MSTTELKRSEPTKETPNQTSSELLRALQESEELHRLTLSNISDAVFITDSMGAFTFICPNVEVIFGYSPSEVEAFGNIAALLGHGLFDPDALEKRRELSNIEWQIQDKTGQKHDLLVTVKRVAIKEGTILYTCRDITKRKQTEAQLQNYQHKLKLLASELTLAEERERRRIAADLHDETGQTLTSARIQVMVARTATSEAAVISTLDEVLESLRHAIEDIHDLIFDLSSPLLDEAGFAAALAEWLQEVVIKKHGLQAEFSGFDQRVELDEEVRVLLFRNVRELLTNVIKHAQANKISVNLEGTDDTISVVIEDDGQGFDPLAGSDAVDRTGRFGLFSIRERMFDLGGTLEIDSQPGQGCTAILTAPLRPHSQTE